MKFINSLTYKYVVMSLIIVVLSGCVVGFSFLVTHHMKGEARKINLAGRQRMLILHVAMGVHELVRAGEAEPDQQKILAENVSRKMRVFEEVLYGLRDGGKSLNLRAIDPHDKASRGMLTGLITSWQSEQKPLLTTLLTAPSDDQVQQSCQGCHAAFNSLSSKVDRLVSSIDQHYTNELHRFVHFRVFFIVVFSLVAAGMVFYTKKKLIDPLKQLENAAKKIGQGNFDIKVPVDNEDELGALAQTFNFMNAELKKSFLEQDKNFQHLSILNKISTIVSQTMNKENQFEQVLQEILGLNSLSLQKKGAFFLWDEESQVLNLSVAEGFGQEQCRECSLIKPGECLCGLAAAQKTVIFSLNNSFDPRHIKKYVGICDHGHVIFPLITHDTLLGILCLYLEPDSQIPDAEVKLLQSCVDIISTGLQNALNHQEVTMLAHSLNSSQDLIIITDLQGTIIHANPMVLSYSGYPAEEMVGREVFSLHASSNPAGQAKQIIDQTMATGNWEGELSFMRREGGEYPVTLAVSAVLDDAGQPFALIGIARDITERRQSEEALIQSESKLRAILDNSGAVIYLKDRDGRYLLINKRYEELFGVDNATIAGTIDHDYFPKEQADVMRANDLDVLKCDDVVEFEEEVQHADGVHTYISVKFPLHDAKGKAYSVCGISTDITSRKKAEDLLKKNEKNLRAAQRIASLGSWEWNVPKNVLCWSEQVYNIFGLPPQDSDRTYEEFLDLVHPEDKKRVMAEVEASLGGDGAYSMDHRIILADQTEKVVHESAEVIFAADGSPLLMIGTVQDITERKRMEAANRELNRNLETQVAERTRELVMARKEAEAANQSKSEFLANMSHELRTPLNSIIGFAEVIADEMAGPINDSQREYLGDVIDSSTHLLSLINDILDLSKVEAGQGQLDLGVFSVSELVSHSMVLFKEKAMKHQIALKTEIDEHVGEIRADERKIKQVLVNLLANAMKFTPDGGQVQVQVTSGGDEDVRFLVRDTGIGITEEDISRLFQPFQQLETELTRKYPGTGLGLSLCRRFVELHNGRIWVESEPGAGSSFIFELPVEPTVKLPDEMGLSHSAIVLPGTKVVDWHVGRRHIERLLSLGQREHFQFGLFRFQSEKPCSGKDFTAIAEALQNGTREHDMIMADCDRQVICLAVMGKDRQMLTTAQARFNAILDKANDAFKRAAVFVPDDGSSFAELMSNLHTMGRNSLETELGEIL